MRYAHHVPKQDAAKRLTDFVNAERGVSRDISPTAENSEELGGISGTDSDPPDLIGTH